MWATELYVTDDVARKFVPVIVSVCAAAPAVAEVGEKLVKVGCRFATATGAEPDLVESWVDVAVTVAFPAPEGVKTPADETVPPVADHVTAEP